MIIQVPLDLHSPGTWQWTLVAVLTAVTSIPPAQAHVEGRALFMVSDEITVPVRVLLCQV